ncbi:hypothetical protein BDN70DRAFT_997048 [Pholiota conissans]|uniref:Uncharacterized protein n=1 Tax=Pholiota conissans TaxID=109636 RepID=A0A9P5YSS8_9AGAR|nr:hypothetical protein BDN70DRAFT_997048 [Pholiota conissans]
MSASRASHFWVYEYLNSPENILEVDLDLIGPPNDPRRTLLSDEEVLRTHRRNADFDFVTPIPCNPTSLRIPPRRGKATSCRHASRVLDAADINQLDRQTGQIILLTTPEKVDHALFIDFALTTQTWNSDTSNHLGNCLEILDVLQDDEVPFDEEIVLEHSAEPDDWDYVDAFGTRRNDLEEDAVFNARDMFPYITLL